MSNLRLIIKTIEVTESGLLIRSMEIIDSETGETVKPTKLTPELAEYLKMIEIDVSGYFEAIEMKKKNPNFTKLCDTFKLYK